MVTLNKHINIKTRLKQCHLKVGLKFGDNAIICIISLKSAVFLKGQWTLILLTDCGLSPLWTSDWIPSLVVWFWYGSTTVQTSLLALLDRYLILRFTSQPCWIQQQVNDAKRKLWEVHTKVCVCRCRCMCVCVWFLLQLSVYVMFVKICGLPSSC